MQHVYLKGPYKVILKKVDDKKIKEILLLLANVVATININYSLSLPGVLTFLPEEVVLILLGLLSLKSIKIPTPE